MRELVAVVVAGLVVGCGGPDSAAVDASLVDTAIDADEGVGFRVQLDIIGVRDPLPVVLHDVEANLDQNLLVTEDSAADPFRFPHRLPDGESFTIAIAGTQDCRPVASSDGAISGADATVSFVCDGLVDLKSISSSPALRFLPSFDPRVIDYALTATPLLAEQNDPITITPVPRYADATLEIMPATPKVLVDTTVKITVSRPPFTRDYTTTLARDLLHEAYVKASDPGTNAHFGGLLRDTTAAEPLGTAAVAVSGDTLVVGAPGRGAAYVYIRKGLRWIYQATLGPIAGGDFGSSVAIDGDMIVVGARSEGGGSGAAYVFQRGGVAWSQISHLTAAVGATARLGHAVAISGTHLVVGAPFDGSGNEKKGTAIVYRFENSAWVFDKALVSSPVTLGAEFGSAVAISGNRIAIGAPRDGAGAGYVFSGAGVWSQEIRLPSPAAQARFGTSIGLVDGELLVIGAPEDGSSQLQGGRVYVFRFAGTWSASGFVEPQSPVGFDHFGYSVAVARETTASGPRYHVIAGAPDEDSGGSGSGGVCFFRCTATTCAPMERLAKASNVDSNDHFGTSVAVDSDTFAVGAPSERSAAKFVDGDQSSNSVVEAGAVYVFR